MEKGLITLGEYIAEKNITMKDLERMTGVTYTVLATNRNVVSPTVSIETIIKIYEGTKKEFGVGLACVRWLDFPAFWKE